MAETSVINDLLSAIVDTRLFGERRKPKRMDRADILSLLEGLVSVRGEASSSDRAAEFWRSYKALDSAGRTFIFRTLANDYGANPSALRAAAEAYLADGDANRAKALQKAAEPRRTRVFERLNLVRGGMQALVAMRTELLERLPVHPDLWVVDDDLKRLLRAWFNRGFLELRQIDWQTSAAILDKFIRYESVHAINDFEDLRRRIDVPDRRLFSFFHPSLGDEPLIFVEVAFTNERATAIGPILAEQRTPIDPHTATTAVFYSINNCQVGLRGISFGHFLIKQVAQDLAREMANLKSFITLSPMPGFAPWLRDASSRGDPVLSEVRTLVEPLLEGRAWLDDAAAVKAAEGVLMPLAAHYLTEARDGKGRLIDPVARFHLGNGARLEEINWSADNSPRGRASSLGIMVNYAYVLSDVEDNHEAFVNDGEVAVSQSVQRLARGAIPSGVPASAP